MASTLSKAETILKSNPNFHQSIILILSGLSMGMVILLLLHLRLDILSVTDALYLSNLFTQPVHTGSFMLEAKRRQIAPSLEGSECYSSCIPCLAEAAGT